jgi:hypothetical protein
MRTNRRIENLFAILFASCGLIACTSTAATPSGTGGATGTGGSGTTGAGGAGTGTAGTTGTGAGGYATNSGVLCPTPAQALITNFTYTPGEAGTNPTDSVHFGDDSTTFSGSEYVYPTSGDWVITSDVTNSNWHITGTVGTYSGFGLSFDSCSRLDASAYSGISFTLSGTVGAAGTAANTITMGLGTLPDTIAASWLDSHGVDGGTGTVPPGACIPTSGTNQYSQSTCGDPTEVITVPASPAVQSLTWASFTGGKPMPVVPSDILTVYWFFPPPVGAGTTTPTTYAVDITIDNLAFTP